MGWEGVGVPMCVGVWVKVNVCGCVCWCDNECAYIIMYVLCTVETLELVNSHSTPIGR